MPPRLITWVLSPGPHDRKKELKFPICPLTSIYVCGECSHTYTQCTQQKWNVINYFIQWVIYKESRMCYLQCWEIEPRAQTQQASILPLRCILSSSMLNTFKPQIRIKKNLPSKSKYVKCKSILILWELIFLEVVHLDISFLKTNFQIVLKMKFF